MKSRLPAHPAHAAFTLTELIGVIAVLAIIGSFMIPSVMRQIERAYQDKERQELPTIGTALAEGILRTKTIPKDTWTSLVAAQLACPAGQISHSATGLPRLLLADPEMRVGSGAASLPYTQDAQGSSSVPEKVRLMVVSSHRLNLPAPLTANPLTSATFNALWNTPTGQIPAGWPSEWTGHPDRLFVHRLDLTPRFCRLLINNLSAEGAAAISVEDSASLAVPLEGWDRYYLEGTLVAFYHDGGLEGRELLTESRSYVSEQGIWRGLLRNGKASGSTFLAALEAFQNAPSNLLSPPGVDQDTLISTYRSFALGFSNWAQAGFPGAESPEYQSVSQSRDRLEQQAASLMAQ